MCRTHHPLLTALALWKRLIHKRFKAGQQKDWRTWGDDSQGRSRAWKWVLWRISGRLSCYLSSHWTAPDAWVPLEHQLCLWTLGVLGVGRWPSFILPPPLPLRLCKWTEAGWFSYLADIPPYLEGRHSTAGFSTGGQASGQASISRRKHSSLSVFHVISLLGQIDNIWKIDKKHRFPSSQDFYYNLSAFTTQ